MAKLWSSPPTLTLDDETGLFCMTDKVICVQPRTDGKDGSLLVFQGGKRMHVKMNIQDIHGQIYRTPPDIGPG